VGAVLAGGARDVVRFPSQVRRFTRYVRHAKAVEQAGEPAVTKAFQGPPTRFNTQPEAARRCTFVTLPLGRLREVRRATGATLNDVFLTITGGAVRRHLEDLGEPPSAALTTTVPAALPARPSTYGNGVTTLYVSLHSDMVDPIARLAAVQGSVAATRRSTDRDPRLLPDWQRYPRLNGTLIRFMELTERRGGRPAYNLIVSNVRGPSPFSLAGVPVVELRSLGPLSGRFGLNLTAWSYGDDFTIGIHTFASAGAGLDRLGPLFLDELTELERRAATAEASA
jgi:WS/DGAT/MGAT family acyltransferase